MNKYDDNEFLKSLYGENEKKAINAIFEEIFAAIIYILVLAAIFFLLIP